MPENTYCTCPSCQTELQLSGDLPPGTEITCAQCSHRFVPGPDDLLNTREAKLRSWLPEGFADVALGRPRFRVGRGGGKAFDATGVVISLPIAAISGIALLVMAYYAIHYDPVDATKGPSQAERALRATCCCFPFTAVFAGATVWFGVRAFWGMTTYAVVFAGGFVTCYRGQFTTWKWSDVATVHIARTIFISKSFGFETGRALGAAFHLCHRNGTEYVFSYGQEGARRFGELMEEETLKVMMPQVLALLEAGETVDFSPLQVDLEGASYRGSKTAWSKIGGVSIHNGRLSIPGVWRGPLEEIANHHVLLVLLKRFGLNTMS